MRLKTVAYTSRARLDLSDAELDEIRQSARMLNALDGITGLLLFDGTRFLQIIEGSEDAIDNLVERLRRDRRHSAFEIRDERYVDQRSFPDWSMEFATMAAGFDDAPAELASLLPQQVSDGVRDVAIRMSAALAADR